MKHQAKLGGSPGGGPTKVGVGQRSAGSGPHPAASPSLGSLLARARRERWAHLAVINLRIVVGFAFVPAGLKKILGEPFTDPSNTGPFHEFLHALYATGPLYLFVGVAQLLAAILLMTQRFATVGALLATPIVATILVFAWSTEVYPTASVVTLIALALLLLLVWDAHKWRAIFGRDDRALSIDEPAPPVELDLGLWRGCGATILLVYFIACAVSGGVYRPRGIDYTSPEFYVLPAIALIPVVTFFIERRRRSASVPTR